MIESRIAFPLGTCETPSSQPLILSRSITSRRHASFPFTVHYSALRCRHTFYRFTGALASSCRTDAAQCYTEDYPPNGAGVRSSAPADTQKATPHPAISNVRSNAPYGSCHHPSKHIRYLPTNVRYRYCETNSRQLIPFAYLRSFGVRNSVRCMPIRYWRGT